ncbi:MAG: TIGR01777 family protein [Ramlibacter sp.]|nr:TIGR01777 family protein [Ramlibacter sp.]
MSADHTVSDLRFGFLHGREGHVVVTGGTGFIGHSLVPALAAQGWRVSVLTRRDQLPEALRREQVRAVRSLAEIPDSEAVDAVINLAGARILGRPWTAARRAELLRSRVDVTRALVAWMERRSSKPRCLLSASAVGFYGVQAQGDDTPLTEDAPPQPIFMSQLCQQWEQAAAAAVPLGVRVACLRFGVVLGEGGALPMLLLPVRLGIGGRLGSGRQWLSWVHIDDLLQAMDHAWQTLEREPAAVLRAYNVTAPEAVRQSEFSRIAAGVLGRPSFMPTPGWPARLLLGEQADLLLEGQRVVPARLQREGMVFRYPQLRPALEQLVARGR